MALYRLVVLKEDQELQYSQEVVEKISLNRDFK